MLQPATVGLDIAKNVFHAYGVECPWREGSQPPASTRSGRDLLCQAGALPRRHRGLRDSASLGSHHREAWPSGPAHAASLREALREEPEKRCSGCRSHLRSSHAPEHAVIRYAQRHGRRRPWLLKLLQRRTSKIAAVAMANKMARIAWVLMARGGAYHEPVPQTA